MSFPELNRDPLFNTIMQSRGEKELEQLIPETNASVSIMRIKLLAENVIRAASEDVEKAKIFLNKISYLDNFIRTKRRGLADLMGEVQRLKDCLALIVPRSIRGTQSLSTPPPLPSKATTSSPSLPKLDVSGPTSSIKVTAYGTPLTFEAVIKRIQALDLSDAEFSKKIRGSSEHNGIIKDLEKLKSSGVMTAEQTQTLSSALTALSTSYAFSASVFERAFLNRCALSSPALTKAMKGFDEANRREQRQAKSDLLKAIKECLDNPSKKIDALNVKRQELERSLPGKRFSNLAPDLTSSPPFNKNFVIHLSSLIRAFEDFSLEAHAKISNEWGEMLKAYENKYKVPFGKMLENYPYMNPSAYLEKFLQMMQGDYFEFIELDIVNNQPSIGEYLQLLEKKGKKIRRDFFTNIYAANYIGKHIWLAENFKHIVKPYNQAEAAHTNLGEGVCFQNCLDRSSVLLNNPKIADREIQTGSTQVGRFHQAKTKSEVGSRKGLITSEEMLAIQTESSKRLGLTLKEVMQASGDSPSSAIAALSKALNDEYIKNGKNLLCVLGLFSLDAGHAINIQINNADKEYRFIDDNLGICSEFASAKEFMQALKDYLKAYYEDYNKFSIQIYDKIPS